MEWKVKCLPWTEKDQKFVESMENQRIKDMLVLICKKTQVRFPQSTQPSTWDFKKKMMITLNQKDLRTNQTKHEFLWF